MNLHKAKGLEAAVVFLADPAGGYPSRADIRVVRAGATACGGRAHLAAASEAAGAAGASGDDPEYRGSD
jgi:ATP-dependent exoDNAse (exonuclease V) beta subunit